MTVLRQRIPFNFSSEADFFKDTHVLDEQGKDLISPIKLRPEHIGQIVGVIDLKLMPCIILNYANPLRAGRGH